MQGFMEEGDGSTLMLLGNLDMDSLHNLVLGLCKGGGGGGSCSGKGESLGSFISKLSLSLAPCYVVTKTHTFVKYDLLWWVQ